MPTLTNSRSLDASESSQRPRLGDFDGLVAAATLFQYPRPARVYVYVCYYGPATIQEVVDRLDLARATAYEDVERLEELGLLERDDSTRPHELTADAFAFVDDGTVAVTPTVLHAVALAEFDDDVAYFLGRYGVSRLVHALRLAGEHFAGAITQRTAASELDVTAVEGMEILNALRPALAAGQEYDPYLDRLFPEHAAEIDLDIDVSVPDADRSERDESSGPSDE